MLLSCCLKFLIQSLELQKTSNERTSLFNLSTGLVKHLELCVIHKLPLLLISYIIGFGMISSDRTTLTY